MSDKAVLPKRKRRGNYVGRYNEIKAMPLISATFTGDAHDDLFVS